MSPIPGFEPDGLASFEARVPVELAGMLQRITRAYLHRGKAAQAAFLERMERAIPAPGDVPGVVVSELTEPITGPGTYLVDLDTSGRVSGVRKIDP